MAKVLQAQGTESPSSEAQAQLALANEPEVYVQFRVAIPQSSIDQIDGVPGAFSPLWLSLVGAGSGPFMYAGDRTNVAEWVAEQLEPLSGSPLVADTWQTIDYHLTAGSPSQLVCRVDGVEIFNGNLNALLNGTGYDLVTWGVADPFITGAPNADFICYFDDLKVGTTAFGSTDIFSEDFEGVDPLGNFTTTSGDLSVIDDPFAPPSTQGRFYDGYPWRFIVCDLDGATLTLLDRLATDRQVTARLGAAWESSMTVPSDSPEINILRDYGTFTNDPFLQEGIGLLYGFRREQTSPTVWVCRFGGLILNLEDDADSDLAVSTLTAFDPWMYLYSRPVRDPDTGEIPGANGLTMSDPLDEQALALLETTISEDGGAFLDTTTGQIDACAARTLNYPQGMSVGEALDQIMATNDCEIMFTPLYDPVLNPGIVAEVNIAPVLGQSRPGAIMAWDKPSRSLVGLNRRRDGTRRTNTIEYYVGRSGVAPGVFEDASSLARFGVYYEQAQMIGDSAEQTEDESLRQLSLRSYGEVTYRISPATARSPVALLDYEPGDEVPVYASSNFREELATDLRVMEIPIVITDNAEEQVRGMTAATIPTVES